MSSPCLRCVPIYLYSKEAKNGVAILRLHINQYIRIMEKITFNQLKEDYFNDDVCMAEVLASTPATGLTIEQAFYLYIRAKNWSDKDEFELYSEGDYYDLVEEAKNMEL